MSYALIDTTDLTTLGNAIRAKTGGSSNLSVSDMATAVSAIPIVPTFSTANYIETNSVSWAQNTTYNLNTGIEATQGYPFISIFSGGSSSGSGIDSVYYITGMPTSYDSETGYYSYTFTVKYFGNNQYFTITPSTLTAGNGKTYIYLAITKTSSGSFYCKASTTYTNAGRWFVSYRINTKTQLGS